MIVATREIVESEFKDNKQGDIDIYYSDRSSVL